MEKIVLNAEIRKETGKTRVKAVRRENKVPCVSYRSGKEALNLKVDYSELWQALHTKAGENALVTLKIKGDKAPHKDKTVLVKEVQREPIKDRIIHVDFNEISLTEKIRVKVPLVTHGESEGVTKDGGVLDRVLWELEVECLPTEIPEKIEVDISQMKIGDVILVKAIKAPSVVKVINDPELIAISVQPPHIEKPEEAVPEAEAAAEPEVIKKGKKEEEVIEEEAGAEKPKKAEAGPEKPEKK